MNTAESDIISASKPFDRNPCPTLTFALPSRHLGKGVTGTVFLLLNLPKLNHRMKHFMKHHYKSAFHLSELAGQGELILIALKIKAGSRDHLRGPYVLLTIWQIQFAKLR